MLGSARHLAAAPSEPACPRCGYDQAGEITRWRDEPAWPVHGRCTECGLDFEWADVFNQGRNDLAWLYEHTPRRRLGLLRAWRTWGHAIIPRRLWRNLRLESRVSISRLLVWPLVVCLVFYLINVCSELLTLYFMWGATKARWMGRGVILNWPQEILNAFLDPIASFRDEPLRTWILDSQIFYLPYALAGPLAIVPLTPVILLMLTRSRAVATVRAAHIARAGIYQLAIFVPFLAIYALDSARDTYGYYRGGPFGSGTMRWLLGTWTPVVGGTLMAWYMWFWHDAIVHGLRMPRGRIVWGLLMVAAGLLAFLVALLDQRFLRLLFW
jgi:hypothetical protein